MIGDWSRVVRQTWVIVAEIQVLEICQGETVGGFDSGEGLGILLGIALLP